MNRQRPTTEPAGRRFARRAVTIPLCVFLCVISLVVAPLLMPLALAVDGIRPRGFVALRCVLFFPVYLLCEVCGLLAAFALWLAGMVPGVDAARVIGWHHALQRLWAGALFRAGAQIFSWRVELALDRTPLRGPCLVFVRHSSIADTVIPAAILAPQLELRLRTVLKRELLRNPCLDVVGNRLPNYFAQRGSADPAKEVAGVVSLLDGIGPGEGVLIYPEGTRFTPEKKARLLDRLRAAGDRSALERAEAFRFVLPPRSGGPLALLERAPTADVLFVAHSGFEEASTFRDFLDGGLVGRTIRVETWSVRAQERPADREGLVRWLDEQWKRMDRWVEARGVAGDGHPQRTPRLPLPA